MSRENQYLGHAVVDGRVRYLSVSALEKANRHANGCLRRWHYRYIGGKVEEESEKSKKAKEAGTKLHSEIEHYLRTGEKAVSALVLRGMHFLPDPMRTIIGPNGDVVAPAKPNLLLEHPLHTFDVNGNVCSPLSAAGIPIVGYIDCAHRNGINKGASDPSEVYDPPGTIEIIDWKYKGNTVDRQGTSTLTPPERLIYSTQMAGYGEWFRRVMPDVEHVRLSHGVFPLKGGEPRKITKLHVIQDCAKTWEYVEGLARTVVDVAKETDVNKVPPNLMACEAYGGCPHRLYCTAHQTTSLSRLFGETAAEEISKEIGAAMPLLDQVTTPQLQQSLAEEEARLRAQQQQIMTGGPVAQTTPVMQPPAPPMIPAMQEPVVQPQMAAPPRADGTPLVAQPSEASLKLLATWNAITAYANVNHPTMNEPMGFPALGGEVAQLYARARGFNLEGVGLAGAGVLGRSLTLYDVAKLDELLGELRSKMGTPQVVASGTGTGPVNQQVSHPTPAPVLGALTPQQPPAPIPTASPSAPLPQGMPMMLPPEAPASIPALAVQNPDAPKPSAPTEEAPKRKRGPGRPKASSSTVTQPSTIAGAPVIPSSQPGAPSLSVSSAHQGSVTVGEDLEIYVDSIPNCPFNSLAMYVHTINQALAKRFCVNEQGQPTTQDIRCAPKGSPLAFGGWEGAVYEIVCTNPPPNGCWVLDARGNRLAQVVADALFIVCASREALYVRGV